MKNKALLIVDIQNDYFDGGSNPLVGSSAACAKTAELINFARNQEIEIIYIRHIATRPGSTFFLEDTYGSEIHERIKPNNNDTVIIKHFPNSFIGTNLKSLLDSKKITDLIICGMMTNICIDSTVRAAKDFGYNCILISDGTATKDLNFRDKIILAKDVQLAFISSLGYYFAEVKTAVEYIEKNI